MKQLFLFTILFGIFHQLTAQKTIELGISSSSTFGKNLHVFAEHPRNDRSTLQGGIGLDWEATAIRETEESSILYKKRELEVFLGMRRYYSDNFHKFFTDVHLKYAHLISIEENFPQEQNWFSAYLRASIGYKWLIKSRITIEPSIGYSLRYTSRVESTIFIADSFIMLRLGYRLGGQ